MGVSHMSRQLESRYSAERPRPCTPPLTDCLRCRGSPVCPTMTVSGKLGTGWRDCQRPVTKRLPADRIAISPRNVVTARKKKRGRREVVWGRYGRRKSERWVDKEERRRGGKAGERYEDSHNERRGDTGRRTRSGWCLNSETFPVVCAGDWLVAHEEFDCQWPRSTHVYLATQS